MEYIRVTFEYLYEVPEDKRKELLKDTYTNKLFYLEDGTEEFNLAIDTLEEIKVSKSLERIEINDEEY